MELDFTAVSGRPRLVLRLTLRTDKTVITTRIQLGLTIHSFTTDSISFETHTDAQIQVETRTG